MDNLYLGVPRKTLALIPCLNEEATIGSVVLRAKQHVDEVLVVNDGSIDATALVAEAAGATVITHKMNRGKSAGVKTGFRYALEHQFDAVVTLDGDGQHNPDEIPNVLGPLLAGEEFDLSLGIRFGDSTEMPMWRKFGKRVLDYSTSFGNGVVTDSQCGFRAFNKKAVLGMTPRLQGNAFSVESEQLLLANKLGLRFGETRVSCRYTDLKTSTKSPTSHGVSVLSYVIWMVAERRPLVFIGIPGFVFALIGLYWGIRTMQIYNQTGNFLISYALLTALFLIIGAIALFMALMLNTLPHIIKRTIEEKECYSGNKHA